MTTYHSNPELKLMYKVVSPTEAIVVQILGRDLGGAFSHKHVRITFPDADRLNEELKDMHPSTPEAWEALLTEYLMINKEKLAIVNERRQMLYDQGQLKL